MKKRIRKTGEVVDVIAYSRCHTRMNDDYVSYIDSKGEENHKIWFKETPKSLASGRN